MALGRITCRSKNRAHSHRCASEGQTSAAVSVFSSSVTRVRFPPPIEKDKLSKQSFVPGLSSTTGCGVAAML
eukprot:6212108-Pleurochrysis_carterae.AAC.4